MDVGMRGSLRYQKNWLRKERRPHARVPRIHVRNVKLGREVSSVIGTVRATCSIREFSMSERISDELKSETRIVHYE